MKPHRCIKTLPCALCRRGMHLISVRRPSAAPARVPLPVVPCKFVGDELTAAERTALNLDHRRQWTRCDHPAKPLGKAVCGCQGCGPRCPGYAADATPYTDLPSPPPLPDHTGGTRTLPRWQPVPPPAITPTRDRLVITVATGEEGAKTHALTGASQRRYAGRVGADYVVLTDRTQDWFMLEKFRYGQWVPHYPGGTLCIDADVWVSRDAPDLFDVVPPDRIGASVSDDIVGTPTMADFNAKLRQVCESQGVPVPAGADRTHWNSGLVFVRPEHAGYWTPPANPIPRHWISEELWSKVTTCRAGWKVHDLPTTSIHWQWWRDRGFARLGPPLLPFVHPAGLTQQPGGLQRRLDLFRFLEASGA